MSRIWKWPLQIVEQQILMMPAFAEVLTVQMQGNQPHLWALVDEREKVEARTFAIYGTGHPVPDFAGAYIATIQTVGGNLVWHVFERGPA